MSLINGNVQINTTFYINKQNYLCLRRKVCLVPHSGKAGYPLPHASRMSSTSLPQPTKNV